MPSPVQNERLVDQLVPVAAGPWAVEASAEQKRLIMDLIGNNFIRDHITSVWSINNYFLEAMYKLKKEEMKIEHGEAVKEEVLLHVTKESGMEPIFSNNFNWRKVQRGKYGLGISFSDDVVYCHRYSNFRVGHQRVIIVSRVLVSRCKQARKDQLVPPPGFDTTVANHGKVLVKYCDNEFLPVFVAYYNVENVDPASITDQYQRSVHEAVLKGVNDMRRSPQPQDRDQPNPSPRQPNPSRRQPNPSRRQPNPSRRQPNPSRRQPNPSPRQPVTSHGAYVGGRGINDGFQVVPDTLNLVDAEEEPQEINCCTIL